MSAFKGRDIAIGGYKRMVAAVFWVAVSRLKIHVCALNVFQVLR